MHCYAAETDLYDCAINGYKNPASTGLTSHPLPMLDTLHECLMLIWNYFDTYFSIDGETYFDVLLTAWGLGSSILISFPSYVPEVENWDSAQI